MSDYFAFGPFRLEGSPLALYRVTRGERATEDGSEFVALTPKALDVLHVLVADAGKLVTKDELMQRVWRDAFVEEGSIANHISMLRKVLNPHFDGDGPIATVARRGYRFTAPVTLRNSRAQISLMTESGNLTPEAKEAIAIYVGTHENVDAASTDKLDPPASKSHTGFPASTAISAALAIIIVAAIVAVILRPAPASPSAPAPIRRSVAVLPMKNLSGDAAHAWLSTALSETISAELAGGNQFRVVSGENVVRMQQELAPPVGVGLTRKQLDDIGRDLACDLILSGNYLVVGGKVRVDVRLDEVATGEAIASASVTDDAARFLDVILRAGSALRAALKLDQPTTAQSDVTRASFSASPEALQSYFHGLDALRLRDGPRARDFFQQATAADDSFALAHSALSTTWRLLGYDQTGAESAKRALDLASRLSLEDRMGVEAQYHEATASWTKAIDLYRQLWALYPDNLEYGLKLGNAQWLGGRSPDALATVEQMRKMPERDSRDSRIDLIEASAADSTADLPRASVAAARAAEKAQLAKANVLLARARLKQGVYANRGGKLDDAVRFFREAESLFSQVKDVGGTADAIRWQGVIFNLKAQPDQALKLLERANQMVAPLGYVRLLSAIQGALSVAYRLTGDSPRGVAIAEASVASARESGDRRLLTDSLIALGVARRFSGEYAAARAANQEAFDEATAIGELRTQSMARNNTAVLDFLLGDLAAARQRHETALADDRLQSNPPSIALRLGNLSRVLMLQDELVEAEKLNAEECRVYESLKIAVSLAWCRTRLAELANELGRKGDAEALVKAIAIADFGAAQTAPVYIARFARVQLALGNKEAAAETIAAAERVQAKAGIVEDQAIQVATVRAEVDASLGRRAAAIDRLRKVVADAEKRKLLTFALDARLVLSRLDPREASATVDAARKAGFKFIARKAAGVGTATH